jgi:hypothetical protein
VGRPPEPCRPCPLSPGDEELEEQSSENSQRGDQKTDCRVAGVHADRPPAVRVQQGGAKHLALEEGRHLTSHDRVGRLGLRQRARLRVGQAGRNALEVVADEVVRVDLGLVAVVDLLAGQVPDLSRVHSRVERATELDLARGREGDLLRDQLVVHHVRHEVALVEKKARAKSQDDHENRLKRDYPPPDCAVHLGFLLISPFRGFWFELSDGS